MNENQIVDARNLSCPQPVIHTRNAMKAQHPFKVQVSQADQVDNVRRMAERAGWSVSMQQMADYYQLTLVPGDSSADGELTPDLLTCSVPGADTGIVVLATELMGTGDEALGRLLMKAYVNTLPELDHQPRKIIMFNGAVKLAAEGSPVIDALQQLQKQGTEILVCGTCLDFFSLKESLQVGTVSNMYDIAGSMAEAGITYLA